MSTFLKSGASVRSVARFVKTVRRADFVLQDWHGNQADEFELMSTITEIQEAIEKLPSSEKSVLAAWLQSKEEPIMSEAEETALLARLDTAAAELDAGGFAHTNTTPLPRCHSNTV